MEDEVHRVMVNLLTLPLLLLQLRKFVPKIWAPLVLLMLLEGKLVRLVVVRVFPELPHERVIISLTIAVLRLPELLPDSLDNWSLKLWLIFHSKLVSIAHGSHTLAAADNSQLLEDIDHLLELLLADLRMAGRSCLVDL